jgi:hypothetical protein
MRLAWRVGAVGVRCYPSIRERATKPIKTPTRAATTKTAIAMRVPLSFRLMFGSLMPAE